MSKKPQVSVGDTVTVVVKNRMQGMLVWRPATDELQGKIMSSPAWVPEHSFCMTGSRWVAMRVIRWSNVVSITQNGRTEKLAVSAEVTTKPQEWQIAGSRGATYTVSKVRDNWRCTCVAGQFNRACRHVAQAQKLVAA
tara:strand:+ start:4710 stop:5123 length:414 start_codon:yes stop_codon:yes gene_type:complete